MTSFIICSIDAAKFKAVTQNITERMGSEPSEIIGIHDARNLCEGYNRGVAHARGETIVFCHDDIEILTPDFAGRLRGHMEQFDVAGVAGTERVIGGLWSYAGPPYLFGQIAHPTMTGGGYEVDIFSVPRRAIGNIAGLDGVFIAVRRAVLDKVRFDEKTFDAWHLYDLDFTFAAHLAGFRLAVMADIQLIHQSAGNVKGTWKQYMRLFNRKYLNDLYPMPRRTFVAGHVIVDSKEEVLEVMTPSWWDA